MICRFTYFSKSIQDSWDPEVSFNSFNADNWLFSQVLLITCLALDNKLKFFHDIIF